MRLVLLGPPGAGKGTQARVLSNNLHLLHISTGDIFREARDSGTKLGNRVAEYMNKGLLVPDDIVNQVIFEKLKKSDVEDTGFILDGYPRTRQQAEALDKALTDIGVHLDFVIYMKTSRNIILERLTGRRVCANCSKIYHIKNIPPKREDICDFCSEKLIQRDDDKKETVIKRLEVYQQQTQEVIDYYRHKGLLKTVSGDLEVRQLYDVLYEFFGKKGLL